MADEALAFHMREIQLPNEAAVLSTYGMGTGRLGAVMSGAQPFDIWSALPPEPGMASVPSLAMNIFMRRDLDAAVTAGLTDSLRRDVDILFTDRQAVFSAAQAVLAGNDSAAVRTLLPVLGREVPNLEARRALSDILQRQAAGYVGMQQYPQALDVLTRVLALTPVNTYTLRLIMIAAMQTGDRSTAAMAIDGIKRINPGHAGFRDNQATIRAQQGAVNDALLLYENAITLDPDNEEIYCNMASFHYSQGRVWEAVRVLEQATKRAYYPAKPYFLLGGFYAESGKPKLAMQAYEGYLRTARPGDPYEQEIHNRITLLKPALQ
jgi:tetratricopeptide (TPR) repeat protein